MKEFPTCNTDGKTQESAPDYNDVRKTIFERSIDLHVKIQVSAMRVLSDIMPSIGADRINNLSLLEKALTPKSFVRHLLLVVSRVLKGWAPVLPKSFPSSQKLYPISDEAIITLRKLVCIPSWSPSVQASLELHVQRLSAVTSNYG